MKPVLALSTASLLGLTAADCSNAPESVAPDGGTESGEEATVRDGPQTPSDDAGDVAIEVGARSGVGCNVTAACDVPLECCSTYGPGASGTCVAPGTCQAVAVACAESYTCALGQACCVGTSATTCEDAGCPSGTYQLCDTSTFSCPSGYSCSMLLHSATPVCMPSDGGTPDAGQDASSE